MAIVKACKVSAAIKNTGVDCEINMGPTSMLVAVPKSFSFTDADLADPVEWFKEAIHANAQARIFPIFGNNAPIRFITNNKEADVIAVMDDGSKQFVRYGFLNRMFQTTNGGLCYAKALQSFVGSGYRILEFDNQGHLLARDNGNGTYGGLKTDFLFSDSPDLADFKNPAKTNFSVSYSPTEYVQNGIIFSNAEDLLDLMGLIDAKIVATTLYAASVTKLWFGVQAECSQDDLVELLGAALQDDANFVVTNKATGAVVATTAIDITHVAVGILGLTGTFVSGQTYVVTGALPSVLYTNGVEGYDINIELEITIP